MKIEITHDGVTLRLSFQEYAATSAAIMRHARHSVTAQELVRAGLPKIQVNTPATLWACEKCREQFPEEDIVLLNIDKWRLGSDYLRTCPHCGSGLIKKV